jgi:tRNA (uracil-5-)-methyltransferase
MFCNYFNRCGSCLLGNLTYDEQLNQKIEQEKIRFKDLWDKNIDIIQSEDGGFRDRAEFRIWKTFNKDDTFTLNYAMNDINKEVLPIESCAIVNLDIHNLMAKLLPYLSNEEQLHFKLFSIEFLSSNITKEILVTLIYHKKLNTVWQTFAKILEEELNIKIIGRSRKQKNIVSDDFINEEIKIFNNNYKFQYKEGGFTQPNQKVNQKMIEWVLSNISTNNQDLCELYCGGGNFTIPLSSKFNKVLATEISKTSIKSAKLNCQLNNITNIDFIRMSSEEFIEAKTGVREFTRLKDIDLDSYNFHTIFLDPPRAGVDNKTLKLAQEFEQIIYISCNPETLKRDLDILIKTHKIQYFALFDQFAFSKHIESGIILKKYN